MKGCYKYLFIFLVSFFFINLNNVFASDYCSRFYTDGSNSYILRDDNQILIEDVEFNTTFRSMLVQEKNYYWTYYYSKMVDSDLLLIYIAQAPNLKGTLSTTNGEFNLSYAYTRSSTYPVYEIKIGHDNTIQRVRKVLGNGSLTSVSQYGTSMYWLSSWGTNNTSFNELSVMNMDTDKYVTFAKNEENYCALPLTIPEPTFNINYIEGIIPGEDTQTPQNVGVNVEIDFGFFDIDNYDYLLSYDEGQTFENINENLKNQKYIITKIKNFNVLAKVVDKNSDNSVSSSLYIDSINELAKDSFIVFTVPEEDKEYVTIEDKKYLFKLGIQTSFNYDSDYFKYYVSYDGGNTLEEVNGDAFQYLYENTSIYAKITDLRGKTLISEMYIIQEAFKETVELGQKIIFSETCQNKTWEDEDTDIVGEKWCVVTAKFINANDNNFNYYIKSGQSSYFQIYMSDLNNYTYRSETDYVNNLCVKITDKRNNIVLEECYINTGFTAEEVSTNIFSSFDKFSSKIIEVFKIITYFFNNLPLNIQYMFILSLVFIICLIIFKFIL